MENGWQAYADKVCHICGHAGFAASIKTCSLCKVSSEHIYCMRIVLLEVPEDWHCEECSQNAEAIGNRHASVEHEETVRAIGSAFGKQEMQHFSHKSTSRKIEAGKVKFITAEEVATLASGIRSRVKRNTYVSGYHGDLIDVKTSPIPWQKSNTPLKSQGDCLSIREPGNISVAVKEQRQLHKKMDAEALLINDLGTTSCSIPHCKQISSQELVFPQKLVISSDEKNHYALEACWKGAFEVHGNVSQVHCGIYAHLPCQVSPKAYDFSKQLPGTLKFKVLPRESVWPKIFRLYPPTKDDVALYFMCEVERYKQRYDQFVQHIDSNGYALQGCIADVEILLFTSAQLQIDSQKFHGHFYFWGVFFHVKQKKAACYRELETVPYNACTPRANLKHDKSNTPLEGDSMEADMEVDMVGDCHIGRIDAPIKLVAPPRFQKPIQRSSLSFTLNKSTNSALLDNPPGFPMPVYKDERKDSAETHSGQTPLEKTTKCLVSTNTAEDYAVADSKNMRWTPYVTSEGAPEILPTLLVGPCPAVSTGKKPQRTPNHHMSQSYCKNLQETFHTVVPQQ